MSTLTKFSSLVQSQSSKYIVLVKGELNGKKCWHYVLSNKIKMPVLLKNCSSGISHINIEDYGTIITSGWGAEPSKYIQDKVENEGANYDPSEFQPDEDTTNTEFYIETINTQNKKIFIRINVHRDKVKEFDKTVNYGSCDIATYGDIVEIGYL
jgi:hypothetical protein